MSTQRKPRADSPLKTLSVERQASIAEYLQTHTLVETQGWLAADGVKTSVTALSEFCSWYALREQLTRNAHTVDVLQEDFKQRNPQATAAELSAIGQSFFAALALNQQDAAAWVQLQALQVKKDLALLEREKFVKESDSFFAAMLKKAADLNASGLSNADKIAAMRQEAFRLVDELQASGEIQIPTE